MRSLRTACLAVFAASLEMQASEEWWGSIHFSNYAPEAPVFDTDCQTLLAGSACRAQLYSGLSPDSLHPVGLGIGFSTRYPGYFNEGVVQVPEGFVVQIFVQVRAWESAAGASYEAAVAAGGKHGVSNILPIRATTQTQPPAELIGLQSFCLVPEPSPLALGLLGSAVLWCRGRRRPRQFPRRLPLEHDFECQ